MFSLLLPNSSDDLFKRELKRDWLQSSGKGLKEVEKNNDLHFLSERI